MTDREKKPTPSRRETPGVTPATRRAIEGVAKDEPVETTLIAVARIVYKREVTRLKEKGYDHRDAVAGARAIVEGAATRRVLEALTFRRPNTRKTNGK
jgi:hypothetical protein